MNEMVEKDKRKGKGKAKESKKQIFHVKITNETCVTAEHYVKMVGIGDLLAMTLVGPAGMGKTHLVRQTLDELGVPYTVYGGHITLATIYEFLYEHNDELIFFDDVSQLITKTEIMELLKQALNVSGHDRVLHYRSKNVLSENVPNKFVFDGRIIFAFNVLDKKNPNVKAILSRAPSLELKFSRTEILEIMFKIAEGDGGGLLEYEKMIVVKLIEDYTDISMDIELRKLFLAFKIYASSKKLYGEGNTAWQKQVKKLFGKKRESWIRELFIELVGTNGTMLRKDLAKEIALGKEMSPRNAHRKISEFIELEEVFQNKLKGGTIKLTPWKKAK